MYSKTSLIGNVGKDPEIKVFESNTLVKFTLATSEKYKNKNGEMVTTTEWHNITAWGKLAEIIEKYVKKGALLFVEGKLHYSTSGEGDQKKYFTEIKIDTMKMLGGKKEESTYAEHTPDISEYKPQSTTPDRKQPDSDDIGTDNDQLPF